jgi:signal transduction histidine kinase
MNRYYLRRKRILRKLLVGPTLFFFGGLVLYLLSHLPKNLLPSPWLSDTKFVLLVMTLLCLLAYKPIDGLWGRFLKKCVFKTKSYRHIALMNLADDLGTILDLNELGNLVVNTFCEVLNLKSVALIVPSVDDGNYQIVSASGWNLAQIKSIRLNLTSPLIQLVHEHGEHVIVRDLVVKSFEWRDASRLGEDFDSLQANWVIPLFVKKDLVGLIAFSAHLPERTFDQGDFHFFREFAQRVSKCVLNAYRVERLKKTYEQLQDDQSQFIQTTKISAIEQLATGIAHEIHNPLTIISGKAQVLLLKKGKGELNPESVEEVLKTIVKQTKRAADITKKLLMFSQGTDTALEELKIAQIIEDTMALVSYRMSLEGIIFKKNISENVPTFMGNVQEFRELFLNLLLNAIESIEGSGQVDVDVSYNRSEEMIEVRISDSGRGIEPEHLEKVFNPFYTTRHESVGLGLFIAKQIVHKYGGLIRVESRLSEGSLFMVQLPSTQKQLLKKVDVSEVREESHILGGRYK